MKQPWDQVKLRVAFWNAPEPTEGDELRTATGRRYLILSWSEKQIIALVLPKDATPTTGRTFGWTWGSRKRN